MPYLLFLGTFGLLFGAIGFMMANPPPVVFFPNNEPLYLNVFVELPLGTDIEKTNAFSKQIKAKINKTLEKDKEVVEEQE